ncbi:MAG: TatD family hydrolase [Candidatus Onthovivens sp.]|nr:TatD family hydrolase [Candidatus Onthovivens sp.]
MIFDTHIHLNDKKIYENLDFYIQDALNKGVKKFLCVGYDLESSKIAIEIANKYHEVYASIGIIPTEYKQYNDDSINNLRKLMDKSNKIVAIGEIGLDYYWEKEESVRTLQKKIFIEQIELANELNLPISIHCRDAYKDTLDILKEHTCIKKGIMHCFSGSLESAKEFIKLGYLIAFGGVLTFKNSIKTKEVLKNIDLKDVVFETDAPYLAPTPFRGKINIPSYIVETVKYASSLLNCPKETLEDITYKNSLRILNINE